MRVQAICIIKLYNTNCNKNKSEKKVQGYFVQFVHCKRSDKYNFRLKCLHSLTMLSIEEGIEFHIEVPKEKTCTCSTI